MKVRRATGWFAFAFCIACFAGCGDVNFEFIGKNTPEPDANADNAPLAVLAAGPSKNWFANAQAAWAGSEEVDEWTVQDLEQLMAGMDVHRPLAAFLYLSDQGMAEPVIYLPVVDYDQFLDELAGVFKLRRAIASSFLIGQQKFLVKNIGDYAVIGTSLDRINQAPRTPDRYVGNLTAEYDFAFKILGDEFPKMEKTRLAQALGDSLDGAYQDLFLKTDNFCIGLNIDPDQGYRCQALLNPVPEDVDAVANLLANTFSSWGVDVKAEVAGDNMVCDLDINTEHVSSGWAQIEPALITMLESQRSMFAHRKNRNSDDDELPMVFEYVNDYEDRQGPGASTGGSR